MTAGLVSMRLKIVAAIFLLLGLASCGARVVLVTVQMAWQYCCLSCHAAVAAQSIEAK